MDFVWKFIHGPSAWHRFGIFNELEYSVRSVKMNCKDARCIIVGDKPDISQDVIHIPIAESVNERPNGPKQALDGYYKLRKIVDDDMIGNEFMLMCDDLFILKPVTSDYLKINWAREEIDDLDDYVRNRRIGTLSYRRIWRATYEPIQLMRDMRGQKTYDWETHTPRYMEKDKLKGLLDSTNFVKNPKLIPGVYDGMFAENTKIITEDIHSDLFTYNNKVDFDREFNKTYMHIYDHVITSDFIQHMEKKFGKCN